MKTYITKEEKTIRIILASNPKSHGYVLKILFKDQEPEVRLAVAKNHNTPTSAFITLVSDKDPSIRKAILEDDGLILIGKLNSKILAILAASSDKNTKELIAYHPNASAELSMD